MNYKMIFTASVMCFSLLFANNGAGQQATTISPGGTLLPPGKADGDTGKSTKKLKLKTSGSKKKTVRKTKIRKGTTKKSASKKKPTTTKLKLSNARSARPTTASTTLTRLPFDRDQINKAEKELVKKTGARKTTKVKSGSKLAKGGTSMRPGTGARRPSTYADKSPVRQPTKKPVVKKKTRTIKRQVVKKPATKKPSSPKGVLKNAQTGGKAAPEKKVTFNRKVQAKRIPKNPAKKLAKSSSSKLKKAPKLKLPKVDMSKAGTKGAKIAKSAKNVTKVVGATAVLNDVIGTDPISLGIDAGFDLINGTDNAKKSLKNVKKSWDKSLTKQAFTDPKAAGKRVGDGVKKTSKKIGNGVKKTSKNVGKFVGNLFKKNKSKKKKKK